MFTKYARLAELEKSRSDLAQYLNCDLLDSPNRRRLRDMAEKQIPEVDQELELLKGDIHSRLHPEKILEQIDFISREIKKLENKLQTVEMIQGPIMTLEEYIWEDSDPGFWKRAYIGLQIDSLRIAHAFLTSLKN